ncbi:MAG: hypothetical protein AAFO07_02330 [Bacteroidota bacterium]
MYNNYSSYSAPKRAGGFKSLSKTTPVLSVLPYSLKTTGSIKRKSLKVPLDDNSFIKPIKQSFVKNPRLMPMTRIFLTLIAGWAGKGTSIKTTVGVIAKHLNRSRRQVFRYLKDAVEEGYLTYNKRKGRDGLYVGIQIWLNFGAIRFTRFQKNEVNKPKTPYKPEVTYKADINTKQINNKKKTPEDEELWKRLLSFGATLGYLEKENCSSSALE